jgi:hypothetical protein
LFDGVVNNSNSSGVVNVYGSKWLWMPKFKRPKSSIEEEGTKL